MAITLFRVLKYMGPFLLILSLTGFNNSNSSCDHFVHSYMMFQIPHFLLYFLTTFTNEILTIYFADKELRLKITRLEEEPVSLGSAT